MAMGTKIRMDLNRATLLRAASTPAGRLVLDTTRRVLNRALVTSPVDTGTLRASHTSNVKATVGKVTGRVETRIKYGLPVHEGVDHPVVIVPKRKKALKFTYRGRVVYAKRVVLPPRAGRPWLREALISVAVPAGFTIDRL